MYFSDEANQYLELEKMYEKYIFIRNTVNRTLMLLGMYTLTCIIVFLISF